MLYHSCIVHQIPQSSVQCKETAQDMIKESKEDALRIVRKIEFVDLIKGLPYRTTS